MSRPEISTGRPNKQLDDATALRVARPTQDGELPTGVNLTDGLATLREAQDEYKLAVEAAGAANRRECSALNALNAAQRDFDAACAEVRKGATYRSDWARSSACKAADAELAAFPAALAAVRSGKWEPPMLPAAGPNFQPNADA